MERKADPSMEVLGAPDFFLEHHKALPAVEGK
jgi:hypothetical protein